MFEIWNEMRRDLHDFRVQENFQKCNMAICTSHKWRNIISNILIFSLASRSLVLLNFVTVFLRLFLVLNLIIKKIRNCFVFIGIFLCWNQISRSSNKSCIKCWPKALQIMKNLQTWTFSCDLETSQDHYDCDYDWLWFLLPITISQSVCSTDSVFVWTHLTITYTVYRLFEVVSLWS